MFKKNGRSGGIVSWTYTNEDREQFILTGTWYSAAEGETVFVEIRTPDGGLVAERRGTLHVERGIIGGKVFFASVKSLGGDVEGSAYYVKQAVEDYVSKVTRHVMDQRKAEKRQAETVRDWADATSREWIVGEQYEINSELVGLATGTYRYTRSTTRGPEIVFDSFTTKTSFFESFGVREATIVEATLVRSVVEAKQPVDANGEKLVEGTVYVIVHDNGARSFRVYRDAVVEDDDSLTLVFEDAYGQRDGLHEARIRVEPVDLIPMLAEA
jgi:hypothetical protein